MYAFLLSIGIIVTAIGVFTIGFGIPINEFSLGNTLIIAGTTAFAAGLVLIGLAAAVRELRRIAGALPAQQAARAIRQGEPVESSAPKSSRGAPGARVPFPPMPAAESPGGEQRPYEPRLAASSTEAPVPEEMPSQRPRPNIFAAARSTKDTSFVPEQESAPLDTTLPRVAASGRGAEKMEVPSSERRAEPASERRQVSSFDMAWPADAKTTKPAEPRPVRPASHEMIARAPKAGVKSEPEPEERERGESALPRPTHEETAPSTRVPEEPRPVTILKSGVIDGMAYTLYTDGSIEAQLPQGTMHFGSIEELRIHLERNP